MKKILIITFNAFIPPAAVQVVTGLLTGYIAKGQGIDNELSFDEWNNIKINGVALERLGLTNGDANEIKLLFGGTPETADKSHEPIPAIYHEIKGVSFGFEGLEDGSGVFLLTSFEVETKQAVIEICEKTISLGQPISNLGVVKFNTRTTGAKSIVYTPVRSDGPYLVIEFDQTTKIVTEVNWTDWYG